MNNLLDRRGDDRHIYVKNRRRITFWTGEGMIDTLCLYPDQSTTYLFFWSWPNIGTSVGQLPNLLSCRCSFNNSSSFDFAASPMGVLHSQIQLCGNKPNHVSDRQAQVTPTQIVPEVLCQFRRTLCSLTKPTGSNTMVSGSTLRQAGCNCTFENDQNSNQYWPGTEISLD